MSLGCNELFCVHVRFWVLLMFLLSDAIFLQEEAMAGDVHFTQALPDISDIKLGPAPLEFEDRPLTEVCSCSCCMLLLKT